GAVTYSDGRLRVRFAGDRVETVERLWVGEAAAPLAAARRHSRDFIPRDARPIPTRAERAGHPVDAYRSESLRGRFDTEWVSVRSLGPEGRVQSMIIATLHAGDAAEPPPSTPAPAGRESARRRAASRSRALWSGLRARRPQVLVPLALLAVLLLAVAVWRVRERREAEGAGAPTQPAPRRVADLPEPGLPLSFDGTGTLTTG